MTAIDEALTPPGTRPIPNQPDLDQAPTNGRHRPQRPPERPPPPHDLDAERALLGAAMLGNPEPLDIVPDTAFYLRAHAHCANTIRTLAHDGAQIDPVTIADHLAGQNLLDQVGGIPALNKILADTPTARGGPRYAEIVLRHHQARQLLHLAEQVDTTTRTAGPAAALVHLRDRLASIDSRVAVDADLELDEFLDQVDDDYDWLIPDLLERRDRVVLTAVEGTGKSTLLRQIAVQLTSGLHPFTLAPIDPLRVFYVDCENSPRQARRALRQLRDAAGGDYLPGHLRLRVLGNAMAIADPEIEADLAARVRDHRADVVIIGPLYKLITGDPIKEEPAKAVADAIDRLRNITAAAFLIEAHSPYPESGNTKNRPIRPYGASLWSRWPEFGIHLADDGKLLHWRGQRDQRQWPARLAHAQPWPWAPVTDDQPTWDGPTECADAIVAVLEELGGTLSATQIEKRLRERGRGYRTKTVLEAADLAHRQDRIERHAGPRGAYLYSSLDLSDQPLQETF